MTAVSIGAGMMTRIWLDAGASTRSVCTSVLAAGGGLSTAVASTLLRSSVAAIFAGGVAFALEMVGAGIAGPGAGAEAGAVSSVANCSTVSEAVRSSAAVGSTLGQATREFILSARRVGRWAFEFAPTIGRRFSSGRAIFVVALCWVLTWLVACAGFWCACGGRNPARWVCRIGRWRLRSARPRYRQQIRSPRRSTPRCK